MDDTISRRIEHIRRQLPDGVTLVAVSKFHPVEALKEAYGAGQRVFGESHVQELMAKVGELPQDVHWHFIGHLQTNKVKYIAPFIELIHAVDTFKLLKEIDRQGEKTGRVIDCLMEVHVAEEESKYGFQEDELKMLFQQPEWCDLRHVRVRGLMCMATFTDNQQQVRQEFGRAKQLFDTLRQEVFNQPGDRFDILSMGMSDDFPIAVEEGSTMVRVGSGIFGPRQY